MSAQSLTLEAGVNSPNRFDPFAAEVSQTWPHYMVGQPDKPVRVFLVDDDAHVRRVIAQEIMSDSRTLLVGQACSVKEGRRSMQHHEFDVLLVDLNLGDGEGLELLDTMHGTHPRAQAIVVSVTERDEKVMQAFEMGVSGYLLKNSCFGSYAQAVLQVANGGASITPCLAKRLLARFDKSPATFITGKINPEEEHLSTRECEVLRMIASGYTSAEIASYLAISTMTVNTHIRNIYRKLQVSTRAQAVRSASLRGIF